MRKVDQRPQKKVRSHPQSHRPQRSSRRNEGDHRLRPRRSGVDHLHHRLPLLVDIASTRATSETAEIAIGTESHPGNDEIGEIAIDLLQGTGRGLLLLSRLEHRHRHPDRIGEGHRASPPHLRCPGRHGLHLQIRGYLRNEPTRRHAPVDHTPPRGDPSLHRRQPGQALAAEA